MDKRIRVFFAIRLNAFWLEKFELLKKEFPAVEFINNTEQEKKPEFLKDADAVVAGRLTEDEIEKAKKLKAIFVPFTGLNSFPLSYIHGKQIIISNTHANSVPVAEHAITLALSLLHRITEFHNDLSKGEWHWDLEVEHWTSLFGMPCSILGYGSIGRCIAKMLSGFDCAIYAFRKNSNEKYDLYTKEISSDMINVIDKGKMIFICLPLTDETNGIINREVIDRMKGKYVVNIGRGALIDEDPFYDALSTGKIKGAGLDVWFKYPPKGEHTGLPANKPFHELKNIVMTPHKAGHTEESILGMIEDTYQNIRSWIISGQPNIKVPVNRNY
jgi:phosphoglycerate dehydrogenase-like enzyme